MKPRFTLEQHVEMSALLREVRSKLQTKSIQLGRAYPKNDKTVRKLFKVVGLMDEVRSEMEEHLFRDCPREANIDVYYPIFKISNTGT
jgi:hypothetical protein